jgi:hypothetical protein
MQYGIHAEADRRYPRAALCRGRSGGRQDASGKTELFFKNEVFKVCRLFQEETFGKALSGVSTLRFVR